MEAQHHIQAAPRTIWISRSSERLAADIAARLHGLGVELRILDEASLGDPSAEPGEPASGEGAATTRIAPSGGLSPGALRRVRDHIEMVLSDRIEVPDLARIAGLSDCHFARSFRRSMGVPPHRYIVSRRIEVAAALITKTRRTLINIALAVGFADQSHFTRAFTRARGESPGAYRRRSLDQ